MGCRQPCRLRLCRQFQYLHPAGTQSQEPHALMQPLRVLAVTPGKDEGFFVTNLSNVPWDMQKSLLSSLAKTFYFPWEEQTLGAALMMVPTTTESQPLVPSQEETVSSRFLSALSVLFRASQAFAVTAFPKPISVLEETRLPGSAVMCKTSETLDCPCCPALNFFHFCSIPFGWRDTASRPQASHGLVLSHSDDVLSFRLCFCPHPSPHLNCLLTASAEVPLV